ncbi:hypothetical protein INT48_007480 [Thamnidium elegans]|uniref:Uncharacterized protein n=1 Tax=Thamnidium elegans TaxID=101142 RepID=A0A8H7SE28_9FUNG|nr:hypothetical protein INT48_007480 [Thamnidium elegans]
MASFSETLVVISNEARNKEFEDVFDSFFFNDKRCQNRALYMTSRLKQNLEGVMNPIRPSSSYGTLAELQQPIVLVPSHSTPLKSSPVPTVDGFWRMIAHRLYTLNYILFVLPSDSKSRIEFLNKVESNLSQIGDGNEIHKRGGMESHFAVRYALQHKRPKRRKTLLEDAFELEKRKGGNVAGAVLPSTPLNDDQFKINSMVEKARLIIEQCLESESKLSNSEKDAMYIYHSMRNGLHGAFEPHIELEEDRSLRHRLKRTVDQNNQDLKNPFEDEDCIVIEDCSNSSSSSSAREVDSGFYDGWAIST